MTYSLYFNLLSLHCAYRYCVPAGDRWSPLRRDLFVLMFYRSIMRDVIARQGRAPALQGYLYTHSCEIFAGMSPASGIGAAALGIVQGGGDRNIVGCSRRTCGGKNS